MSVFVIDQNKTHNESSHFEADMTLNSFSLIYIIFYSHLVSHFKNLILLGFDIKSFIAFILSSL